MPDAMQTSDRLARLRQAREVIEQLENNIETPDPKIQRMRGDLQSAGGQIRTAGYKRHMEDALGRAAGMAIGHDLDLIADKATRIMDGDIDLTNDPIETVERETDERGRVPIGTDFADMTVKVAVLDAETNEKESQ